MEPDPTPAEAPAEEIKLNPGRLSRKAVCTGLLDLFSKGRKQGTAAALAVARTALMDAAKLHGLTEKKADGQKETWAAFLDRIARGDAPAESGQAAAD